MQSFAKACALLCILESSSLVDAQTTPMKTLLCAATSGIGEKEVGTALTTDNKAGLARSEALQGVARALQMFKDDSKLPDGATSVKLAAADPALDAAIAEIKTLRGAISAALKSSGATPVPEAAGSPATLSAVCDSKAQEAGNRAGTSIDTKLGTVDATAKNAMIIRELKKAAMWTTLKALEHLKEQTTTKALGDESVQLLNGKLPETDSLGCPRAATDNAAASASAAPAPTSAEAPSATEVTQLERMGFKIDQYKTAAESGVSEQDGVKFAALTSPVEKKLKVRREAIQGAEMALKYVQTLSDEGLTSLKAQATSLAVKLEFHQKALSITEGKAKDVKDFVNENSLDEFKAAASEKIIGRLAEGYAECVVAKNQNLDATSAPDKMKKAGTLAALLALTIIATEAKMPTVSKLAASQMTALASQCPAAIAAIAVANAAASATGAAGAKAALEAANTGLKAMKGLVVTGAVATAAARTLGTTAAAAAKKTDTTKAASKAAAADDKKNKAKADPRPKTAPKTRLLLSTSLSLESELAPMTEEVAEEAAHRAVRHVLRGMARKHRAERHSRAGLVHRKMRAV